MIKELQELLELGPDCDDQEGLAEWWCLSEEKKVAFEQMGDAAERMVHAAHRGENDRQACADFKHAKARLATLRRLLDEGAKRGTLN